MALPLGVFSALEKCDVVSGGGFAIPYTIVLEAGRVAAAFHVTLDNGFRKEYDLSPRVLANGLGIDDETIEFLVERRKRRMNRIAAVFVELVSLGPHAVEKGLNVEFLTPQHTHNLLWRGSAEARPFNLAEEPHHKSGDPGPRHRQRASAVSAVRSGLLQGFCGACLTEATDHAATIRVRWERLRPGQVNEGYFDAASKSQQWSLRQRRNLKPLSSPALFPYERGCTFEGPQQLSADTTSELDEQACSAVVRAARFVLERCAAHWKRDVCDAELFFSFRSSSNSELLFLYASFLRFLGDPGYEVRPRFFIPRPYTSSSRGGARRPRSAHTHPEDLIVEPRLEFSQPQQSPQHQAQRRRRQRLPRGAAAEGGAAAESTEHWLLASAMRGSTAPDSDSFSSSSEEAERGGSPACPGDASRAPRREVGAEVDLDKVLRTIETSFAAPLPQHTAHKGLRKCTQQRVASFDESANSTQRWRRAKVSPTPNAPREHPLPNFAAMQRRQLAAIAANTRSLLAVLEGQRPLDERVASRCGLTRAQRRFLAAAAAAARAGTPAGTTLLGSAKVTFAEERGLPEWEVAAQRQRGGSDGRPQFYVPRVLHEATDRDVLRMGSEFDSCGRPQPLKRHSRSFVPPGGFPSANAAKQRREEAAKEKRRRRESRLHHAREFARVEAAAAAKARGCTAYPAASTAAPAGEEHREHGGSRTPSSSSSSSSSSSFSTTSSSPDTSLSRALSSGDGSRQQRRQRRRRSLPQQQQSQPPVTTAAAAVSPTTHPLDFPELEGFLPLRLSGIDHQHSRHGRDADGADYLGDDGVDRSGRSSTERLGVSTMTAGSSSNLAGNAVAAELQRLDAELEQRVSRQGTPPSVAERVNFVLAQPLPAAIAADSKLRGAAEQLQRHVRAASEWLAGLAYQLNSYRMTRAAVEQRRAGHSDLSGAPTLLFSVPREHLGSVTRRVVQLLKSLPYFEQMNTEENISELQFLLRVATSGRRGTRSAERQLRRRSSTSAAGGGNSSNSATAGDVLVHHATALDDCLYASHAERGANIVSIPTFAVKQHTAHYELHAKFSGWVLTRLRVMYLERLDEMREEAEVAAKRTEAPAPSDPAPVPAVLPLG